ncbi:efflux RND transporter permease subunit, partial [bacterium]|nr:efflux RND transporter permease subunit [bacterium]
NIFRHREQGKTAEKAATEGAEEVSTAIVASTLTTIAVFLPMGFIIGVAGQIFKDLAFTVNYANIASLFVSLSLIPMLSVGEKEYKEKIKKLSFFKRVMNVPMLIITKSFNVLILLFLKFKYTAVFITFIIFVCSLFMMTFLDKELMPKIDQGQFMIKVTMPTGTLLDVTNDAVKKIEEFILTLDEVESVSVSIGSDKETGKTEGVIESLGSHQGQISVNLKKDRKHPSKVILSQIKDECRRMKLGRAQIEYVVQESVINVGAEGGSPIVLEVKGHNLQKIKQIADVLVDRIKNVEGTFSVKHDFPMPSPETKVNIRKDKASVYGLSVTDIAKAAQIALKGLVATKYKEQGKEIDVRVRLRERDRNSFVKLQDINVRSKLKNYNVPLSEVAYLAKGLGPSEIKRKDQERVITVTSDIFKRKLSDVMADIEKNISKMRPPAGYKIEIAGESEAIKESFKSMQFALLLSILLVYMIMSSQFESLLQPFIIMFSVPFSLIGVATALFITGMSLNGVVILGVILLGGVVVNNAIVLISCANDLRAEGKTPYEAALMAGKLRLRPILMTTLTTVLGLIPLSLGISEGAELQQPLAITVMGGLSVSTFLTLLVIPCIYVIFENFMAKFFRREKIVITDAGLKKI